MNRRRFLAGGGAAAVLAGVGGLLLAGAGDGSGAGASGETASTVATATATVTRRDLAERTEVDGTLGYGDVSQVSLSSQGTVTALPALGSVIERGGAVAEVDGHAVPALFGERPLWRTLDPSAPDGIADGADVAQIEANLIALGFATEAQLGPNDTWSQATTAAVKRWQESLGKEKTGIVSPADAVFLPGPVRVAGHAASVGGPATGPILDVTATTRSVTTDLDATRQDLVTVGQAVEVELPDGAIVAAHVASIATVAERGDASAPGQKPTVEVTISLDDPAAGSGLDEAPVAVRIVTSAATGVLAVPVDALLALAEGGYAVERVTDAGSELVAVELGAFADGFVEIAGDIAEGDHVVVPE